MSRFSTALRSIDRTERKLVSGKLSAFAKQSSIHGQFLKNIEGEALVPDRIWRDFILTILDASAEPHKLGKAIRMVLRKHLFSGPPAKCSPNAIFGRATTSENLARSFATQKYFGSLTAALSHVRAMKKSQLANLREKWRHYSLAPFVMWSTFDPAGGRPFHGVPRSARHLRALFGLPANDADGPILLLEYILPDGVVARMPTVVEAYAGDDWLYYFRPAGQSEMEEGYSRTYVWDELARKGEVGRPEVVHRPVTGHVLVSDIEEVP
jgi:hypothetical protein